MNGIIDFLVAAGGGLLPALLWLWFWLQEDRRSPEPRKLIALAFLTGMVAVALVIPLEEAVAGYAPDQTTLFFFWAVIEELMKFALAGLVVLRRRENDEPLDPIIYMIATALGFSAAENALFLLSPVSGLSVPQIIITGGYRFVGATLVHVLSSAIIGAGFAFAFYKRRAIKREFVVVAVILSICLHWLFNVFIMSTPPDDMVRTFAFVWVGVVALLAMFEVVKRIPTSRS